MRRRRAWSDTRFAQSAVIGNQEKSNLLLQVADSDVKTVSRILVDMVFHFTGTDENESENVVDLAIGVVSLEAFNLGTFPDADAVADYPQQGWLFVATLPLMQSYPSLGGVWRIDAHFKADIRGQRKVDRGVLYMTTNVLTLSGTPNNPRKVGRIRALCLT